MPDNIIEIPERIEIPHQVATMMYFISERDYHCYVVGDYVRNMILGEPMGDIDVIVNAELDRLELILEEYRIIERDPQKGEMVVMAGGIPVMISSFRCEGSPEAIPVDRRILTDELSMRDFTVNTICADRTGMIIDPFNGTDCLRQKPYMLKAVGEDKPPYKDENGELIYPSLSVENNPLYLFKALELMGSGDYIISPKTSECIKNNVETVKGLTADELRIAFEAVLMSKRVSDVFLEYHDVVTAVFPELSSTVDFDQCSIFQNHTLYEHLCKSVGFSYPDPALRYALLFHGAGKPDCQAVNANGAATYYGHAERSAMIAGNALRRLNMSEDFIDEVAFLINHHDMGEILEERDALELTEKFSKADVRKILLLACANLRAKSDNNEQKAVSLKKLSELFSR